MGGDIENSGSSTQSSRLYSISRFFDLHPQDSLQIQRQISKGRQLGSFPVRSKIES